MWELFEKGLCKMPHSYRSMLSRVGGVDLFLRAASADQECVVLFWYSTGEVGRFDEVVRFLVRTDICGDILKVVVGVTNLDWLIDKE